ncbi:cytochrome P450 monooxygenase [Blastomyces dermatitidis ER-3]|uniref:Cytochrome P450 monooxygenase n=1 Tax=Ajellomyces dermatitidis (strain ER-3 / ATCC MYA-2586) TaxID=559297 RepID=A0ABP2EVD2_AJEDR|nr:cytochrome P450 monooxygenase [Blastomyces dermatitidis ER-3]EEQ86913.2 cytochrome P450 monooxygenase [Blastomyces dermatitidis ER-3]
MLLDTELYSSILNPLGLAGLFILLPTLIFLLASLKAPRLPLINGKKPFELRQIHAGRRFLKDARSLIEEGLRKASAFRLMTENGPKTVLSANYADEIRSHPSLNFGAAIAKEFHADIPGFDTFKQGTRVDEIFQDAVRMKLTHHLGNVIEPISDEIGIVLERDWTNNRDWHDIALKQNVLKLVAQMSSRVFLGKRICRNPDWIRITIAYTIDSYIAALALRLWPATVRSLVSNFIPSCRKLRQEIEEARTIIQPVLDERRMAKEEAIRAGKMPERYVDAMEWLEESAKGRYYDPVIAQLSFSHASIHTTSDLITQTLLDLCGRDELIQEVRDEIVTVMETEGWKKSTLFKLKLMDSVLKETQRLKPIAVATMRRLAEEDTVLSDKTFLPKGELIVVACDKMWDPNIYPNPTTYDPYRFLKLRETPGNETSAQLVSPSPEHLGFGFGKHACPGRFFAANEVKIALCHILLKYDIKLAEGYEPRILPNGLSLNSDHMARISIRRREE